MSNPAMRDTNLKSCNQCNGTGVSEVPCDGRECDNTCQMVDKVECRQCDGTGEIAVETCPLCNGTGIVDAKPTNARPGEWVRVACPLCGER